MPNVDGKKFPYTPKGKAAAKDAAKNMAKRAALQNMVAKKKGNVSKTSKTPAAPTGMSY